MKGLDKAALCGMPQGKAASVRVKKCERSQKKQQAEKFSERFILYGCKNKCNVAFPRNTKRNLVYAHR